LKQRWPILLLGAAIVTSTILLLYLGRDQTPVVDQWSYIYAYQSWSVESLLTPHSAHLVVLPVILYKGMFEVFGLESQLPYQLVNLALSASVAVLLFALIRGSVGDLLALAAATLMLFYGAGADVIVPTFQFTNLIGLASGMGMLLALRRGDVRGDLAACLLLAMSLASFSIGAAFAVGALVMLALRPTGHRLERWWVVAAPIVLYAAWALWARKYDQQTIYLHNLKILGSALVDQLSASLAGISGLFTTPNGPKPEDNPVPIRTEWGPALVVGLAALLIARLRRPPKPGPDALAATTVLVVYFLLVGIALNMFRNTFDTRLVYLGSVLTLLAVAQLCGPYRPSRTVLVVVAVVFAFSMGANVTELSDSAQYLRERSAAIRAKLTAVDLAGDAAPPPVLVEEPPDAMTFNVETFHQLEADFGLPTYTEAELRTASPDARQAADEELVRVLEITPRSTAGVEPAADTEDGLLLRAATKGEVTRAGACVTLVPRPAAKMEALLELPPGGMTYAAAGEPAEVSLGRFADAPAVALPPRSGSMVVRIPSDDSDAPWLAQVHATARTLVCPADGLA
jgi:hypothetical protein